MSLPKLTFKKCPYEVYLFSNNVEATHHIDYPWKQQSKLPFIKKLMFIWMVFCLFSLQVRVRIHQSKF